jgi:hypothetical protein
MINIDEIIKGIVLLFMVLSGTAGYGYLLLGACSGLQNHKHQAGLCIATGLCVYLVICGLLEFFSYASNSFFVVFLIIGCIAWLPKFMVRMALGLRNEWLTFVRPSAGKIAVLIVGFACAVLIANSYVWYFENIDDVQGYLVLYERIMQTGSEGSDQFMYRRFETGLGGGIYFYALSILSKGICNIRVIDIGGGLIILAALMHSHLQECGSQTWKIIVGGIGLLFVVAFSPSVNMTPEIIGIAMLYSMIRLAFLARSSDAWISRSLILGLYAFGLTCLKVTLIIPAVCIISATYMSLFVRNRLTKILFEATLTALFMIVFMLPWMVVSYQAVDTALFPVLGIGKLSSIEITGRAEMADFVKAASRISIIMALPLWVAVKMFRDNRNCPDVFQIGIPILIFVTTMMTQTKYTVAGYRYGYATVATLFLYYLIVWLGKGARYPEKAFVALGLPVVFVSMSAYLIKPGYGADTFSHGSIYRYFSGIDNSKTNDELWDNYEKIRRMQDSIPEGAALLARIDTPYMLNFKRNTVHVMDWPGMIGPMPGLPSTGSSADWVAYLKTIGIRYVAYSYGNQAGVSAAYLESQLSETKSEWQRTLMLRTLIMQNMLTRLQYSEKVIYDDGVRYIVDLSP